MNEEQQAAQSIGKFLQLIKGLGELKPGLESLGSVKQAEQEVKSRLSGLKIDETSLVERTKQLRIEIGELEKKATAMKAEATTSAGQIINRAMKDANAELEKSREVSAREMEKAQAKLDATYGEIEEAEGRLKSLNDGCKLAQKRLDQTNAELDRIVQRARG